MMMMALLLFSFTILRQTYAKNLPNLHDMAKCHLGYDISIYNGYGCWCTAQNDGANTARDGIDECCALHEKCYANSSCKNVLQKFLFYPYNWTCDGLSYKSAKVRRGKCYVTLPENRPTIKCTSVNVGCKRDMCNCDKAVVECLANYEKPPCRKMCGTTKNVMKSDGNNAKQQQKKRVSAMVWHKIGQNQSQTLEECEEEDSETTDFGISALFKPTTPHL